MAIVLRKRSRFDESLRCSKKAFTLGERKGDVKLQAAALCEMGQLHFTQGKRDLARRDWYRAIAIFNKLNAHEQSARVQLLVVHDLHLTGHLNAAVIRYKKVLRLAEDHKLVEVKALVYGNMGVVLRELDRNVEAEACFDRAIKAGRESSHWPIVYKSMLGLAELLASKNNFAKAEDYFSKAKTWFERSGESDGGLMEIVRAKVALKTARLEEAKEIFVANFYRTKNGLHKAMMAEQLLRVAISEDDFEGAQRHYETALKLFYENGAPGWGRRLRDKNYFPQL